MAASGFHIRGSYLSWSVWKGSLKVSRDYRDLDAVAAALERIERKSREKQRRCLCCGTPFTSSGKGHRLCAPCRSRASEAA